MTDGRTDGYFLPTDGRLMTDGRVFRTDGWRLPYGRTDTPRLTDGWVLPADGALADGRTGNSRRMDILDGPATSMYPPRRIPLTRNPYIARVPKNRVSGASHRYLMSLCCESVSPARASHPGGHYRPARNPLEATHDYIPWQILHESRIRLMRDIPGVFMIIFCDSMRHIL